MDNKSIIKIVDIFNQKTYQLCMTSNKFEYFCINKLVLPPKVLFVYIQDYFDEQDYERLGFKYIYKYPDVEYYDIDENKILLIEKADGFKIIDNDWSSFKMKKIASFSSLNDFWNYFTDDKSWYKKYLLRINLNSLEQSFYKTIADSCNRIKKEALNSHKEIELLYQCWEFRINRDYLNNFCPICKNEFHYSPRFPMSLCSDCEQQITDKDSIQLEIRGFANLYYKDGTKYNLKLCYVNNISCIIIYHMGHHVLVIEE